MTVLVGPDGVSRCPWGDEPAMRAYHDTEWGQVVHGDDALFERLSLEAFQSGLSWAIVLRKRERFREVFAGFDPKRVAELGPPDVERLMADAGIIRNRRKIEAVIANARVLLDLDGSLDDLLWSFAPTAAPAARVSASQVPASTAESVALAKELRRRGFQFVGPTTAYATMQATGIVDDHLAGCVARSSR